MVTQHTQKHYLQFSESEVESELTVVSYQILKSVYFLYPVIPVCYRIYMVLFQSGEVLMSDIDPDS